MDKNKIKELKDCLSQYLENNNLRHSKERDKIFDAVCSMPGHFDIDELQTKLEEQRFHVSRATLYNVLELLIKANLLVTHNMSNFRTRYELKCLADGHYHLICTECGAIREIETMVMKNEFEKFKISRFTPDYFALYVYGICSKCKFKKRMQKSQKK